MALDAMRLATVAKLATPLILTAFVFIGISCLDSCLTAQENRLDSCQQELRSVQEELNQHFVEEHPSEGWHHDIENAKRSTE
jgi:uncharacterized protein (DUF486 family)